MRTRTLLLTSLIALSITACDETTPDLDEAGSRDASRDIDAPRDLDASSDTPDLPEPRDQPDQAPDASMNDSADMKAPAASCEASAAERGWRFCSGDALQCAVIFEDGTGCQETCEALGLECLSSFDDEPGSCDYQRDQPALGCMNTGHQSDYCVCGVASSSAEPDMRVDDEPDMSTSGRPPHEELLDELVGYGQGTTGGAGGPVIDVTTLADSGPGSLRAAAQAPGAAWIRFTVSGVIELDSNIQLASDKTIDGRGADITITGYGLYAEGGTSNIILTHLKMRDSDNDLIRLHNGGDRVWVHHCDLSNGGDGAFDATEGVTGVTVSYTHIFDHDKAMLLGAGSDEGDGGSMRWTGHHNWYEDVTQRLPLIRMGRAHSYNNLIMWRSGTAMSTRIAPSQMLVEHNIFMPQTNVGHKLVNATNGAAVKLVGNLERPLSGDEIEYMEVAPETVFDPSDDYAYQLDDADDALISELRERAGWQDVPWPR